MDEIRKPTPIQLSSLDAVLQITVGYEKNILTISFQDGGNQRHERCEERALLPNALDDLREEGSVRFGLNSNADLVLVKTNNETVELALLDSKGKDLVRGDFSYRDIKELKKLFLPQAA